MNSERQKAKKIWNTQQLNSIQKTNHNIINYEYTQYQ